MRGQLFAILLAASAGFALAQDGWRAVIADPIVFGSTGGSTPPPNRFSQQGLVASPISSSSNGTGGLAGAGDVTPEIAALAADMGNDPTGIFRFVRGQIDYQPYYGSLKGARGTLLDRAGNAWDQSSLLMALLKAAGITNVEYVFGYVVMRDWSPSGNDLEHWLGVRRNLVLVAISNTGAVYDAWSESDHQVFVVDHVWVRAVIGGTTYDLDPSYKRSEPQVGLDIRTLSGFNPQTLRNQAGGTVSGASVSGLNATAFEQTLGSFATTLRTALTANHTLATIQQVAGGRERITAASPTLAQGAPLAEFSPGVFFTSPDMPAGEAAIYRVRVGTEIDASFRTDELGGERLTVSFAPVGIPSLWLTDELLQSQSAYSGSNTTIEISIDHPRNTSADYPGPDFDQSLEPRKVLTTGYCDVTPTVAPYFASDGRYQSAQGRLKGYLDAGEGLTSLKTASEALHNLRLNWARQVVTACDVAAQVRGGFTRIAHMLGVCAQQDSYFLDIPGVLGVAANATQTDLALFNAQMGLISAFEHAAVEQAGAPRAVSTARALSLASGLGQRVFRATSANWQQVSPELSNYPGQDITRMGAAIAAGDTLLIHEDGALPVDDWYGFGFARLGQAEGQMVIAGEFNGGFATTVHFINGKLVLQTWVGNERISLRILGTPEALSAEPVDLRTGAYIFRHSDLTLGTPDSPRGLDFTRYYNSSLSGSGDIGRGWTHSCHGRIELGHSPEAAFGLLRSRDAAPFLVATLAALEFSLPSGSAKDLMLWIFASEWAADSTTQNAAHVELGDQRMMFARREDGGWSRPPGTRTELEGTSGSFVLKPHLRGSIAFDTQNRIATWDDPDSNRRTYAYDTQGRLALVTDAVGRTLTFAYFGSNPRITSVTDSTARLVSFGATGDLLTSVTDPENHTTMFGHDSAGRLDLWTDPLGQPVARNFYDDAGRVVRQHSRGDPAQEWIFSYRPGVSTETDPDGRVKTWIFDPQGRLTGIRDPLGNMPFVLYDTANQVTHSYDARGYLTRFYFDSENNLWARENPMGHVAYFGHDPLGRLEWTEDETGRLVSFGYDSEHHLRRFTDAGNRTITYTPYPDGLLDTVTEPGNRVTKFFYDQWGTPSSVLRADGNATTPVYNARGDLVSHTDARNYQSFFEYDKRRLPTSRTDATGNTTFTPHDANGYPAAVTDRRGYTTHTPADNFGLVESVTLPDTDTVQLDYDSRDLLVKRTNGLGHLTEFIRDDAGRVDIVKDGLGRTTADFGYDADGRLTSQANGLAQTTFLRYDPPGRLGNRTDAELRKTSYFYDDAGRRTGLENPRGALFEFGHGTDGQQDTLDYPGVRQRRIIEREERGLPRILRSPSGKDTTLGYDDLRRVTSLIDEVGLISWDRDEEGNPETVTEGNATVSRIFDSLGRVTSCTDSLGNTVDYRYDAEGNITKIIYPDLKEVNYTYDGAGRMKTVTDWAERTTTYFYDSIGRLERTERPNGTIAHFEWDAADRLGGTREKRGPTTLWRSEYGYDGADRINRFDQIPIAAPVPVPQAAVTYEMDNRLATLNGQALPSDLDGNMLAAPLGGGMIDGLGWDARNRLITVGNGTTYIYDAENRCVRSTTATGNTTYTWSRGSLDRLLVKANPDGSITRYVHGLGLLYEEHEPAGGGEAIARFYHFNWQGSTVAISDSAGQVTARIAYSPYGTHQVTFGSADTPFLFNGQFGVMTEPHGLLHMMARFYSPTLRRFLSEDPVLFAGGDNFYAYAAGDPINLIDPFGLGPISPFGSFVRGLDIIYDHTLGTDLRNADALLGWHTEFTRRNRENAPALAGFSDFLDRGLSLPGVGVGGVTSNFRQLFATTTRGTPQLFYIENGVRRSLVSQNAGLSEIPATIFRPGSAPATTMLRIDQLMSPKTTVPLDSRYFNIQPPIHTPIQVQPLGLPGQSPTIPLRSVILE